MNPLFSHIARKLTRTLPSGEVTPAQVACVASGADRTVSHPVIARIMTELKNAKPAKQRGHRATNDSHIWEE